MAEPINLRTAPILRMILPFISGIFCGFYFSVPLEVVIGLLIFTALFELSFWNWKKRQWESFRHWQLRSLFMVLLFFFAGWYTMRVSQPQETFFFPGKEGTFAGRIVSQVEIKEKSVKAVVRARVWKGDRPTEIDERVLVYFRRDSLSECLRTGDEVICHAKPMLLHNGGNPNEFDYTGLMSRRGVRFQCFVPSDKWETVSGSQHFSLLRVSGMLRDRLLKIYRKYGLDGDEYAVAAALTLGYKNELDYDTRQAYSNSGAMHILAVSGLHVGIIYLIVSRLLVLMQRSAKGRFLRAVLLIASIWFFAAITGFSASVQRAALMITFVILGESRREKISVYNSLAASALILLIINPMLVFEIGFQLSYLAVLSIVYFQPRLVVLLYVKNRFLRRLWELFTVGVAAQIGTGPLALYHFHQFPNYFWLTNLLVVPAAFVVMIEAVVVLGVSFIPVLAKWAVWLLDLSVYLLNAFVRFVDRIPGSVSHIYVSAVDTACMYLVIILLSWAVVRQNARAFLAALALVAVLIGMAFVQRQQLRPELVVFNVRGQSVINYTDSRHNYVFADSGVLANPRGLDFSAKGYWAYRRAASPCFFPHDTTLCSEAGDTIYCRGFLNMGDTTFYWTTHDPTPICSLSSLPMTDYLILGRMPEDVQALFACGRWKRIIITSALNEPQMNELATECWRRQLLFHPVGQRGAFIFPNRP